MTGAQQLRDLLQNDIEQCMRFPFASGEQAIFRGPVAKLPPKHTDRTTDRAPAETDQQGHGMFLGTTICAVIRKTTPPSAEHYAQAGKQRHGSPLIFKQNRECIGSGADKAVLAGNAFRKRRYNRLAIEGCAVAFGDQADDLRNVQRSTSTSEYVICHVHLRHTLRQLRAAGMGLLRDRPT
jgi:hypothetical protein